MVESYPVGLNAEQLTAAGQRAAVLAEQMRLQGVQVWLIESSLVPAEDALFCIFEAPSRAVVEELVLRAELPLERLVEVIDVGPSAGRTTEEVGG